MLWECQSCGSQLVVEDRGAYKKKLEIHPGLYRLSKEEQHRIRACRHPRRVGIGGVYYCSRCGRGPLKEPYEVHGEIFGSCCKDKVAVQEVPA